jgi:hypothetical protein
MRDLQIILKSIVKSVNKNMEALGGTNQYIG